MGWQHQRRFSRGILTTRSSSNYRERENNYWWLRGDDPYYRDQQSWTYSVKADMVSQATANHLLKGGFEFFLHRTKAENISWTLKSHFVAKRYLG